MQHFFVNPMREYFRYIFVHYQLILNCVVMGSDSKRKKLERKFKMMSKDKFPNPSNCTHLHQTRNYIGELNRIIKHFERKFEYVPSSAQVLFHEFNSKQESMLYEKYKQKYQKE